MLVGIARELQDTRITTSAFKLPAILYIECCFYFAVAFFFASFLLSRVIVFTPFVVCDPQCENKENDTAMEWRRNSFHFIVSMCTLSRFCRMQFVRVVCVVAQSPGGIVAKLKWKACDDRRIEAMILQRKDNEHKIYTFEVNVLQLWAKAKQPVQ